MKVLEKLPMWKQNEGRREGAHLDSTNLQSHESHVSLDLPPLRRNLVSMPEELDMLVACAELRPTRRILASLDGRSVDRKFKMSPLN